MVSRLIFRPHACIRWDDGENKIKRIIGFTLLVPRVAARQIRQQPQGMLENRRNYLRIEFDRRVLREKSLRLMHACTYRKPTQVGRLRTPRRTGDYWLRNSAKKRPYVSNMACRAQARPQLKTLWRLFIKNTTPCEAERRCIRGDACPMPER